MGIAEMSALKRLGRNMLSVLIAGVVAYLADKPYLIAAAPVINAAAKWLRNKFGLKNIPI